MAEGLLFQPQTDVQRKRTIQSNLVIIYMLTKTVLLVVVQRTTPSQDLEDSQC